MKTEELEQLFDKHEGSYHAFDKFPNKLSNRRDLHAFLLLDKLVPGTNDIISCAEHDQIWINIELDKLAKVITEEQVIELRNCGVWISDGYLTMFR
jgi:hypothetical protein